jgi:hypothetical protein
MIGPIGPRGQKIMRSANNVGNAGPHVSQTFLNDVFTFLTEVGNAGALPTLLADLMIFCPLGPIGPTNFKNSGIFILDKNNERPDWMTDLKHTAGTGSVNSEFVTALNT